MSLLSVLFTTPPTLASDQFSYQGLTLGAATAFGFTKLEGLDKPDVRSGDTARPRQRGRQPGLNLLDQRTVTATLDIGQIGGNFGGYGSLPAALAALRAASSTEGTAEYPLWVQMPGFPLVVAAGRVLKKSVPWDIAADRGGIVQSASIQWGMSDPYFYGAPVAQTVGLPAASASSGVSFPLSFPMAFGGGANPNQATVINGGDVPCYPVLVFNGPCINPTVQSVLIPGIPTLTFNVSMAAGDQMMVDCDSGAITYTAAGTTMSSPTPQLLAPGSTFFGIPPGTPSLLSFNSQDTTTVAGTLTIYSAMALDALL